MKKGFTLAELLITLTIVGVIAVLTVPNFVRNAHQRANIGKLQTTYAQLQDAVSQVMMEQRVKEWTDIDFGGENDADNTLIFLKKYLDVMKTCDETRTGCFAEEYKDIADGRLRSDSVYGEDVFVVLRNGVALGFGAPGWSEDGATPGSIMLDVNSVDPPNTLGRDLFYMSIDNSGNIFANAPVDDLEEDCRTWSGYWFSCFEYLQSNNWKMDY